MQAKSTMTHPTVRVDKGVVVRPEWNGRSRHPAWSSSRCSAEFRKTASAKSRRGSIFAIGPEASKVSLSMDDWRPVLCVCHPRELIEERKEGVECGV